MSCLPSDHCCSICKQPSEELIKNKVSQFNEGLLKNGSTESDDDSSDSETEDDTATRVDSETNNGNTEQYYMSGVWEKKVDSILSAIGEIEQPYHPNAQASHAHSQSHSSTIQTHFLVRQLQYLLVPPNATESQAGTSHHSILSLL